jgi:uncharacterized protein YndB with AHSA1/START domain
MREVTTHIQRTPEQCWRVLVDASLLTHWVPGLRRATVITSNDAGLPREIHFEFSVSLTYSLVYTYDVAAREVRWEPRVGGRDAVRGFARLVPDGSGTRMTYALEPGSGRSEGDRALGDPDALVAAFAAWMHAR